MWLTVRVKARGSTDGLAAVLRDLLADGERLASLARAGREYAVRNSYETAAQKLVTELLGSSD